MTEKTAGRYHSGRLVGDVSQGDQTVVSNANTLRGSDVFLEDAQAVQLQKHAFERFVRRGDDGKQLGDRQEQLVVLRRVEDEQQTLNAFFTGLKEQFGVVVVDGHLQQTVGDQGQQLVVVALQQLDETLRAIAALDLVRGLFVENDQEVVQSGDSEVDCAVGRTEGERSEEQWIERERD